VFCCASSATLTGVDLPRDATGIISEFDISKTASLAERLQPNARQLIVIAGAAPFDRRWAQIARQQLAAHEKRLNTRYLVGLPHDELLTEVANLPRDTIVIVLSIFRDGAGRDFVPLDIAEEIAIAANAPVYGPYDTLLGRGVVGGYMISFESVGTETADLVLDVLNGKDPSALPPRRSAAHAYRVDARQLERWNLAEKNLPADTVVLFKQSPLWEQHRKLVLATIEQYRVTNMFAAPTMVTRMVDSSAVDRYDHRSLRACIYGGGPMLVEDLRAAIRTLGPCLVQLYGQAESPMTIRTEITC